MASAILFRAEMLSFFLLNLSLNYVFSINNLEVLVPNRWVLAQRISFDTSDIPNAFAEIIILNLAHVVLSPTFLELYPSDSFLILSVAALMSCVIITTWTYGWQLWVKKLQFGCWCSHWGWGEENMKFILESDQTNYKADEHPFHRSRGT